MILKTSVRVLFHVTYPVQPMLALTPCTPSPFQVQPNQNMLPPFTGPWLNSGRRSLRSGAISGCHCARNVITVNRCQLAARASLLLSVNVHHISQQLTADSIIVERQTL